MASYEVVNQIAVITCQHPPVNALSYNLRVGLLDGLEKALSDPNVIAIVITANGRTFIAGADIKEFSTGMAFKRPLSELIQALDNSTKPIVAAIHGTALGGGFEVALACHYRIGTSRCRVGLPEVLIGLLPGAGGTQRLPRLVGPMIAADMICSGKQVRADVAADRGIFDQVIPIQPNHKLSVERLILRSKGIRFAIDIANKPFAQRVLSNRACPKMDNFFYSQLQGMMNKSARGFLAPQLCLEAVRAAQDSNTFRDGLKRENQLFMKLATGSQSRALQHVFFSQRQINKIPGIDPSLARNIEIRKVGVIGCGTMGGGIVMCFVEKGIPVIVLESQQRFLDKGLAVVKGNWARQVKKGRLSRTKCERYESLITSTLRYEDLSDVDIVIEAVFETLSVKKKVFTELDRVCKPSCILASNTSYIPISKIAAVTSRPNKVIGTHFFAPANKMQLLENVRFEGGADDVTCATVQKMAKQIGKKGVLVRSCPGFVGNRMFLMQGIEAGHMLFEGATPSQIDGVMYKDVGTAMGIFAVSDLSGNDIGYKSRKDNGELNKASDYGIGDILVEKYQRLGLKVGKGYYDYPNLPKSRKGVASAFVEDLIVKTSAERGIQRRKISKQEIIERVFYPFINEGFKVLEEGIAIRPSDIDIVFIFGYGFPAYRGGPMHWAETEIGLQKLYDTLCKYYKQYPDREWWKPSDLLKKCVDSKMSLTKYWKKNKMKARL
eukprot:250727_1